MRDVYCEWSRRRVSLTIVRVNCYIVKSCAERGSYLDLISNNSKTSGRVVKCKDVCSEAVSHTNGGDGSSNGSCIRTGDGRRRDNNCSATSNTGAPSAPVLRLFQAPEDIFLVIEQIILVIVVDFVIHSSPRACGQKGGGEALLPPQSSSLAFSSDPATRGEDLNSSSRILVRARSSASGLAAALTLTWTAASGAAGFGP